MIEDPVHWANPELVWVLWAWLALMAVIALLERRGSGALDRLVSSALQSQLVSRPSRWRRILRLALLTTAGSAMALALMQPQMGERFVATPRIGAEIMIAIDVSRSMLADDAKPTRLERAKADVRDLLGYLGDDHVGLIAFAGRASVLSPMTPDKSFLRLALDGAGPHSVRRGGTKLAEAIRRAVVGFGEPGPAQRALILITDGEDHDSFALDAAEAAAEAGIKIIAIGFGDENGSAIYVRDPKTGARTRVVDSDGRGVVSHLNGDLLRDIALATDGAFVPAGTGVLDLASIYDAHISKLTRGQIDDRGRTIRDEAYQLFLAFAFVCLLAGVWVTAESVRGRGAVGRTSTGAALVSAAFLAGALLTPHSAIGQPVDPKEQEALEPRGSSIVDLLTSGEDDSHVALADESDAQVERKDDPRQRFNRANAALAAGELEAAAAELRDARRDATSDTELRYAATYNLGMTAMASAAAQQAAKPEAALAALHEAADWFREAIGMRPETDTPRQNLEVALRRATMLADELAQKADGDVETALEGLIEAQRARVLASATLLEEVSRQDELSAVERMRPAFRGAATEQRVLLSRVDELADRVVREREAIMAMAEDTRSPEDALRGAQFEGVLVYLDGALERMGATRRQLRQRRAERAYRRGSAALGELKRARDQLRDPVEQIGVLLEETTELLRGTSALLSTPVPAASGPVASGESSERLPAFLTAASLAEEGRRLEQRVAELGERLTQAAAQAEASSSLPAPGSSSTPLPGPSQGGPSEADREALRTSLSGAAPLVTSAAVELASATTALAGDQLRSALGAEAVAGRSLADAQELFFDLTRMLEVAHRDQAQIAELASSPAEEIASVRDEYAPLGLELQRKNLGRSERLVDLLARERETRVGQAQAQMAQAAEGGSAPAPVPDPDAPDPVALENQRFDVADQLRALAEDAMQEAEDALGANAVDWVQVGESAGGARDGLEDLRSLFFSLIEHLQRLARDQVNLSDETQDAIALASGDDAVTRSEATNERARAIAGEQTALESRAGAISDALLEQSEQPTQGPPSGQEAGREDEAAAAQERLRKAAEHVVTAQLSMRMAQGIAADESKALAEASAPQAVSVEELMAALALLSPPPPPQDENQPPEEEDSEDSSSGDESQEQEEGDEGEGESEAPEPSEEEASDQDPSQLLQGVRDREAERRRDQERDQQQRRSQPVDKDW